MPSPKFYPFPPERFDARSGASDVHNGNGSGGESDDGNSISGIRRSAPHHPPVAHSEGRPLTDMQALMEAPPMSEPVESIQSGFAVRDHIDALCHLLTAREKYVIDMLFYAGMSLRELAVVMSVSKDTVANVRNSALARMRRG